MRTPQDLPASVPRARAPRGRWWIVAVVVVLVVVLASLKSLATLYTDSLWFSSVHLHRVWSTLLAVKVGLFASFGAALFVLLWGNLVVCDRLAASAPALEPEDELVRRYQHAVRPYSGRLHVAVALVLALIAASGTVGQWNNWILFIHAMPFGVKDPQFHKTIGFFVFTLPFLSFLVSWSLVVLILVLVVTGVFHYLNGGIRAQRTAGPRVRPVVKAHLSILLALIALVKAAGYILQRYQLDVSTNGYVEGAGKTDVFARLPALELLFFVSLCAAAILLYNIRLQGWTMPVLAVGVWAFVALVIGVIYPAVYQVLKVNPAQSTLEKPYIERNVTATRAAYGIDDVKKVSFQGSGTISASAVAANLTTLGNIRLWDPDRTISLPTFQKLQDVRSYYTIQSVNVDRYTIDGTLRPVVVGVRQVNSTGLQSSSWVNTHLQYTHGEGVALAAANQTTSNGDPVFSIEDVPPVSSHGLPKITQAGVYFGLDDPGYVVADSKQPELDYQTSTGADVESHYQGTGGVRLGSWFTKAAFAVRLGDFNLLISNLVTPNSRIMFVRDVQAMAEKAAPFLSFDSSPYAAVVDGHIDWILDAYVTTDEYPYSQNADTEQVPPGSGLPASYNYVRNAVKVVVNAYTGSMTFYAMDDDPILRAYEAAFPGMFTPSSKMSPELRAHLRYAEDMFSIQAAVYGRYHITTPSNFYTAANSWSLSPTTGVGSPTNTLKITLTTNPQGEPVSAALQPMSPVYQVLEEPGEKDQSFTISTAYVPVAQRSTSQILSAFMMGNSNPGQYGQLRVYVTPPGHSVIGPVLADSAMEQSGKVSQKVSLLNHNGSHVVLGNILMVPVDQSMLYVRPLYVESSGNPQPELRDVIVVDGTRVGMESTLNAALNEVLGTKLSTHTTATATAIPTTTSTSTTVTPSIPSRAPVGSSTLTQAKALLKQAAADHAKAEADLKAGTLGGYQSEVTAMNKATATALALLGDAATSSTAATGPGSTTTTAPKKASAPQGSTTKPVKSTPAAKQVGSNGSTTTTTTTIPVNEA